MTRSLSAIIAVAVAVFASGCGTDAGSPRQPQAETPREPKKATAPATRPRVRPYDPPQGDVFPNGKRVAGRAAQLALTYRRGADPTEVARSVARLGGRAGELERAVSRLVVDGRRSRGEVIYAQLSGVTPTTMGAMVVVRQRLEDESGRTSSVTRTLDVRLRRSGGPWRLASIEPPESLKPRPTTIQGVAARVLDHNKIRLSDSARSDIHRGGVDEALLRALLDAAEEHRFAVATIRSGHPQNVWETDRRSAHTEGAAADIYAVDGRLVVRQRRVGSAAYLLASRFLERGARQVGSPWSIAPGPPRSFTDAVHQDHIHVQQRPVDGQR